MSEATATTDASDSQSFAALKRVKAAETEWATKLEAARQESDAALARLRDESAATIKAAIAESEREKTTAVQAARAEADGAAATIVAQGSQAADAAFRAEGKKPEDRKDDVLAVVLGAFASG